MKPKLGFAALYVLIHEFIYKGIESLSQTLIFNPNISATRCRTTYFKLKIFDPASFIV